MNNIVNMVNYYLIHKNADDSVVEYIKNKLNNSELVDLIIIQIELLYTDPTDKLVSNLVGFITNKINNSLKEIDLYGLASLISILNHKVVSLKEIIANLENKNKEIFATIKTKDLNSDGEFNDEDSKVAGDLINQTQDNSFVISKTKSEINSINIWLINLENSFNKKINNVELEELLSSYIKELTLLNRDDFINKYINKTSNKIEEFILNTNLLDTITNVLPELDRIYNNNSNNKNEVYKLLDYYIDLVEFNIKKKINELGYEERLLLKEKINIICREILDNNNPFDDFKVQVINNYMKYL